MKNLVCLIIVICLPFTYAIAQTATYNFDFEDWHTDSSGRDRLDIWEHIDRNGNSREQLHGTKKSTQSHTGNYAVTVHRWYMVDSDGLKTRNPISGKPGYLNGFYKYTDVVLTSHPDTSFDDTATVTLYFTKWNNVMQQPDTIGYSYKKLAASSGYTPFSCAITYTNADQPDSVSIYIYSSKYYFGAGCKDSSNCSFLTIDNLSFSNTTSFKDVRKEKKFLNMYPNPADDFIIMEGMPSLLTIKIYNSLGAFQSEQNVADGRVYVENLSPGCYWLVARNKNQLFKGSFIKR